MKEKLPSPRVSRNGGERGGGPTKKSNRYAIDEGSSSTGDIIECSSKYCRSCTAGVIADCVALCCCPCALLNLLTFALVKVPWKIGSKCLVLGNKKRKKMRKCKKNSCTDQHSSTTGNYESDDGKMQGEEILGNFSARFEADQRVWLELYQVGHQGFGRVSLSVT